jgi:hypothetical protein
MKDLTPEARTRFEQYMQRIRAVLRGSGSADEVEQSVREHVDVALQSAPAPVGMEALASVLEQLGPPERWVPENERPVWRRVMEHLQHGPEEWRLAYLTMGMFVAALLLLPVGIGVLLFIPAFLLARAEVELLGGTPLGARRWLVLPPIWLPFLMLMFAVLVGPIVPAIAAGLSERAIYEHLGVPKDGSLASVRVGVGFVMAVAGTCWMLVAALVTIVFRPLHALFHPVASWLRRKHLAVLAGIGFVIGASGLALLLA